MSDWNGHHGSGESRTILPQRLFISHSRRRGSDSGTRVKAFRLSHVSADDIRSIPRFTWLSTRRPDPADADELVRSEEQILAQSQVNSRHHFQVIRARRTVAALV
jgi:hypothetical protein